MPDMCYTTMDLKKQQECTEARILGINKPYISAFRPLALPSNNHIIYIYTGIVCYYLVIQSHLFGMVKRPF